MNNIPKILHLFWGKNKPLSYMKYLTAYSFAQHNPDWDIFVYTPTKIIFKEPWGTNEQKAYNPGEDWWEELKRIKNVQIKEEECVGESAVHQSDILRLKLLATTGGLWSDFDIFYIKPVSFSGIPEEATTIMCVDPDKKYHSIGFLGASYDNTYYKMLYTNAMASLTTAAYQGVGRFLFDLTINPRRLPNGIYNLNKNVVYPIPAEEIYKLYINSTPELPQESIGIHWFAGSPVTSQYENVVTPSTIHKYLKKNLFSRMGGIES